MLRPTQKVQFATESLDNVNEKKRVLKEVSRSKKFERGFIGKLEPILNLYKFNNEIEVEKKVWRRMCRLASYS